MADIVKTSIVNVREIHIGDKVCRKGHDEPVIVVAIFNEPGELVPSDHTGTVYCDFEGNPGDVLEYRIDEIDKILSE